MRRAGRYRAIVIGASAGGTVALQKILPALPANFSLPIVVAQHLHPLQDGVAIVHHAAGSALNMKDADEKETLRAGFVYFAPPNYHLLIEDDDTFALSIDPRVHFTRPSVDVLFESAADVYGPGLIGVVLSGANQDGADGLLYVKQRGGFTIVQDPRDAEVHYMPQAAIQTAMPDKVLPASQIAGQLLELTQQKA